jgi:hypothetical protein
MKYGLCGHVLSFGNQEKFVHLEIPEVFPSCAAVPNETALGSEHEMPELKIKSTLQPADGLALGLAVSRGVKYREIAYFILARFAAAFVTLVDHLVELLHQVDVGPLFTNVEMVPGPADIQTKIDAAPITGISGIEFREKVGQLVAGSR